MTNKQVIEKERNLSEAIRRHPLFQEHYGRLEQAEQNRKFCRHQMDHLLDVARIAYIRNLESDLGFSKEMIYAAALLHDIGKARQYEEGVPHEIASAEIAEVILKDVLPQKTEEQKEILRAVKGHRRYREDMTLLEKLLYLSDKKSRRCFVCPVEQECNWSSGKKNMEIDI